jgi:N-acetylneuraminic acid mutarotase
LAYGASVSTAKGVVCIGGETGQTITAGVFLLVWHRDQGTVEIQTLPDLPLPLASPAAASLGNKVFVAGGETTGGVSNLFFYLDLDAPAAGWAQLPELPQPVSHSLLLALDGQNSLYLVGGRRKKNSGISEFYRSVFAYDPINRAWNKKKSHPYALAAGTGIAIGADSLVLFGGDTGNAFNQTEELIAAIGAEKDEVVRQSLLDKKKQLQSSHPGFCSLVLLYGAAKDEWRTIDKIPFSSPVTTTAVRWDNDVLIPSGEIRAGVRSPRILRATFPR